jgi:nucleotide-binding universal stress UspA family protein
MPKDITTRRGLTPLVRSVVHPTDFSPASERAFAHALAIAVLRQTTLTLLHVEKGKHDWNKFPAVRETLERWGLLQPGSSQDDVFTDLGVRVTKLAIDSRTPVHSLLRWLDGHPADLLVVATEGRDGLARWMHASVAEAMARTSQTMTLFVPSDAERDIVSLADGNLSLANVLVPVDHSPDPTRTIEFARSVAELAGDDRVTITLLHVGPPGSAPRIATEDGAEWKFVRMDREGDPVEQIVAAAAELKADLVAMPTAGRAGVVEALCGSTTERVLRRVRCALLAIPATRRSP